MPKTTHQIGPLSHSVKLCLRCGQERSTSQFYKDKSKRDGFQSSCIPCRRDVKGITRRERENAAARKDREKQRLLQREFNAVWRGLRQAWTKSEVYKEWAKAVHLEQVKQWAMDNPEKAKEKSNRWAKKNREKVRASYKKWAAENRDALLKKKRKQNKRRRLALKDDPVEILKKRIRDRTRKAIIHKRWQKRSPTREMLGCSFDMLKEHIENQFTKGMTWDNRGEWHIDHIIPLASANSLEELEKLAHFSNLRPMWADENMAKGDQIIDCQPELVLKH